MAAYIAFIASLNLCVGYALGVYIGVLPGITPRHRHTEDDEEPIGLDIAVNAVPEEPVADEVEEVEEVDEDPVEEEPEVPNETEDEGQFSNILQGLEAFKLKLDSVSEKLNAIEDDRAEVDEAANELKQANTEYLDKANEALEELNEEDPATASEEHLQLQETLTKQSAEVKQSNDEIDEILNEEDTETVRKKLLDSTEQLSESAEQVEQAVQVAEEAAAEPEEDGQLVTSEELTTAEEEPNAEEPEQLVALTKLMDAIDNVLAEEGTDTLLQVGAIDLMDEGGNKGEHIKRLLAGLENVVAAELGEGQTLAVDESYRLILHLPGDDLATADKRCERVRQQIAATTFQRNGEKMRAMAMCAVAEATGASGSQDVLDRLNEALVEAKDRGESCTVHHTGNSVEPVPTLELDIEPANIDI